MGAAGSYQKTQSLLIVGPEYVKELFPLLSGEGRGRGGRSDQLFLSIRHLKIFSFVWPSAKYHKAYSPSWSGREVRTTRITGLLHHVLLIHSYDTSSPGISLYRKQHSNTAIQAEHVPRCEVGQPAVWLISRGLLSTWQGYPATFLMERMDRTLHFFTLSLLLLSLLYHRRGGQGLAS